MRDRATGFVLLIWVTAPELLADHPRLEARPVGEWAEADAAYQRLGQPPLVEDGAW